MVYYESKHVTLHKGNCLEIIPTLGDGDYQLLITDPPYGVEWRSDWRKTSFGFMQGDASQELGMLAIEQATRRLPTHRHLYVFGPFDLEQYSGVSSTSELIWDKGLMGMGDLALPFGKSHEPIQFGVKGHANSGTLSARLRKGSVLRHTRSTGTAVRHPSEKPVSLIRELIESSSRIGDTVLDPFSGTGSTGIAAILEGRKAILIEIEEQWCDLATQRIQEIESIIDMIV